MPFLEECTTHRSEALRVARPEAVGLARSNQPRPEAEALGRPPRGGRSRERSPRWGRAGQNGPARAVHVSVAPAGGLLVRKAPLGPLVSLEVQFALVTVQLLLLTDVLPHPSLIQAHRADTVSR